ncbi:enolase C-terminal domain-like protein [Hydrogenophaga sp.]|uniref:enolase C-terminal domain-like protein n=1 Tax=Hydrogenophaga sp. TaxID=1904254 RepID=UPI003F72D9E7
MTAPALRITEVLLSQRHVTLRLPFRFGAATVTQCPQAFVRVRAELGGRTFEGASAELMVPKWFDKSPALTHEQNFEQLRESLRNARDAWLATGEAMSPHAHSQIASEGALGVSLARGLPRLAAQFGPALLDKAVADAALRAAGLSWVDGLRAGVLGDPWSQRLDLAQPTHVVLRHTVGLADRLADDEPGPDPQDGLPATMESAIRRHGLHHFKLKLSGQVDADMDRLARIAAVLQRLGVDYRATLDGNETFADATALGDHWRALQASPTLADLLRRTLLLEQPLARAVALKESIASLPIDVPVILDESDDHPAAFEEGLSLGYRGISSKACKGIYRSLANAHRIASDPRLLLSGEDLTCQAGLAVQQDTLLAASLGVRHIERNGHHYVDGFGTAPAEEARAFAQAHAGLYDTDPHGRPHLAVTGGRIDIASLHTPGFASAATPLWHSLDAIH